MGLSGRAQLDCQHRDRGHRSSAYDRSRQSSTCRHRLKASVQLAGGSTTNSPAQQRQGVQWAPRWARAAAPHHRQDKPSTQKTCSQQVKEHYCPPLLSTGETRPDPTQILGPPFMASGRGWRGSSHPAFPQFKDPFICPHTECHRDTARTQSSARKVRDTTGRPRPGSKCGNREGKIKPKNVPWKTMFQLARGTSNCMTCTEHMGSARSRDCATGRKIKVTTAWQRVLTRAAGRSARRNIDREPSYTQAFHTPLHSWGSPLARVSAHPTVSNDIEKLLPLVLLQSLSRPFLKGIREA